MGGVSLSFVHKKKDKPLKEREARQLSEAQVRGIYKAYYTLEQSATITLHMLMLFQQDEKIK